MIAWQIVFYLQCTRDFHRPFFTLFWIASSFPFHLLSRQLRLVGVDVQKRDKEEERDIIPQCAEGTEYSMTQVKKACGFHRSDLLNPRDKWKEITFLLIHSPPLEISLPLSFNPLSSAKFISHDLKKKVKLQTGMNSLFTTVFQLHYSYSFIITFWDELEIIVQSWMPKKNEEILVNNDVLYSTKTITFNWQSSLNDWKLEHFGV